MLRIAICDDLPQQTEVIAVLIKKYQAARPGTELEPFRFNSGGELIDSLNAGQTFDIYLLDIVMPGLNGIELAGKLRELDKNAPLVFLTSSKDYALDAFGVSAVQYILKPVRESVLFEVLDKIIASIDTVQANSLIISTPAERVKLPFSSIICVESSRRALRVYLTDGRTLLSKTIRTPFSTSVAPLLNDRRFLHAHSSFVLNMEQVEKLTGTSFVLKGGLEVPVPRYKYAVAKAKYLDYMSERGVLTLGGA